MEIIISMKNNSWVGILGLFEGHTIFYKGEL